jgi:hypothetical protein
LFLPTLSLLLALLLLLLLLLLLALLSRLKSGKVSDAARIHSVGLLPMHDIQLVLLE